MRKSRKNKDSRLSSEEKSKKYSKEIATFVAILLGLVAKTFTNNWLIGGIIAGIAEIIFLKYLSRRFK